MSRRRVVVWIHDVGFGIDEIGRSRCGTSMASSRVELRNTKPGQLCLFPLSSCGKSHRSALTIISSNSSASFFLFLLNKNQINAPMRARPTAPPTAPPTIAPVSIELRYDKIRQKQGIRGLNQDN